MQSLLAYQCSRLLHPLQRAYLRMRIDAATNDVAHMEAEAACAPARVKAHNERISEWRADLALLESARTRCVFAELALRLNDTSFQSVKHTLGARHGE